MSESKIDAKLFRNTLGKFATGVTIVTTVAEDGTKIGVTANSFNSVSLNPPLVLWSLAKSAASMDIYKQASHFAVHILTANQVDISNRFASPVEDRFQGLDCQQGAGGVPLLPESAACFQCKKMYEYEGGDHIIFVGEVVEFDSSDARPLAYQEGRYAVTVPHESDKSSYASEGFLLYLIDRCYQQINLPFRKHVENSDLSVAQAKVLSFLSATDCMPIEQLKPIANMLDSDFDSVIAELKVQGLIAVHEDTNAVTVALTEAGVEKISPLIATGKAVEEDILSDFSSEERKSFRHMLKMLVDRTDDFGLTHPFERLK